MVINGWNHSLRQFILLLLLLFSQVCSSSMGSDTIHAGQSLSGNQTIISESAVFEMGFFKSNSYEYYYIGIWYKKPSYQTVVWVANREQPVLDTSLSAFKLLENGNLVLLDASENAIWSSNSTSKLSNSTTGVLLDNGNFVIRNAFDSSVVIWQSFDHPTDTWLPGGKIGYNKLTNEKIALTPWQDWETPAPGMFTLEVDPNGTSLLLMWNGSTSWIGYWTGKAFKGYPGKKWNEFPHGVDITYVTNENESYFTYAAATRPDAFTRLTIDDSGYLSEYVWKEDLREWDLYWSLRPEKPCGVDVWCYSFSMCNKEVFCACLEGFELEIRKNQDIEYVHRCVRKTPLQCSIGVNDTFVVVREVFFPSGSEPLEIQNAEECRLACLSNCSCTAYAYDEQCFIWNGDLPPLVPSSPHEIGQELHLRVAASQFTEIKAANPKTSPAVIATLVGLFSFLGLVLVFVRRGYFVGSSERVEDHLVLYRYQDLKFATKNFSEKLGEGGFGSVFKGKLSNSTFIAVKKLKSQPQAEKQFRAEVKTIGTIHHANLVRLRGFCAESSRRFLVYDFMPKGSLESVLFQKSRTLLDWKVRYKIAIGVARGLCYLHEGCRDCIIHCDIKPENILLDEEYNPKLADFGLAKLVGRDFSRVLTTMRGTVGYLAPEWMSGVAITPKADVYSYGMLVFELISGRRNCNELLDEGMEHYFPLRVSNSLRLGEDLLTLLDCRLEGSADKEELTRACKVACWCIQDDENNRPYTSQVVHILTGLTEVGLPPVPLFFQRLAGISMEAMNDQETTSGPGLLSTVDEATTKYFSFST